MKKFIISIVTAVSLIGLTACGGGDAGSGELSEDNLKIGVTAGPHEIILEKLVEVAAEEGLEIETEIFTEYVMPNVALDEGELDVNIYQHQPFLDKMNEDRGFDIESVATAVNFPMAVYSENYQDVSELQDGDTVGLPNDPSNSARALLLFELAGMITLDPDAGVTASVNDIVENPKNLEFIELEASQIPRQLNELSASAMNTNYAIEHGYNPREDSIFLEPSESVWTNLIAVRAENKDDAAVQKLIKLYQSDVIKQFIEDEFNGSVLASW